MTKPKLRSPEPTTAAWEPPELEVIPLDCEISAYAPAEEDPLF